MLVEADTAAGHGSARVGVVHQPGGGIRGIPNKDAWARARAEFALLFDGYVNIGRTPEDAEVLQIRRFAC